MAKQKDQGDVLEIFFDKDRDNVAKFQKIVRNAISCEKKNIIVDMTNAPTLPRDYLAGFVLGAKGLKGQGLSVTFVLSPSNYALLKASEHSAFFILELAAVVSDEEIAAAATTSKEIQTPQFFTIQGNVISIADEGMERIPNELPRILSEVLQQGHTEVLVDLTQLCFLTPVVIQTLIFETLNSANALRIRVTDTMQEVLKSDPQAKVLNLDIIPEEPNATPPKGTVLKQEERENLQKSVKEETSIAPDFEAEDAGVIEQKVASPVSPKQEAGAAVAAEKSGKAVDKPEEKTTSLEGNVPFQIVVNSLRIGKITLEELLQNFPQYFTKLLPCGDQIYIDLSDYEEMDETLAKTLINTNFEALSKQKKLIIQLLKPQREKMAAMLPNLEEVEKRVDTTPKFLLVGGRLELYNVDSTVFLDKFPGNFKRLLASGQKNLVVDISHLAECSAPVFDLLVLSYLEAVGRGMTVVLRIRPEMEGSFQKSGRGRSLPLEIVRPEVGAKVAYHDQAQKLSLDLKKLQDKDRLSDKVLNKEYQAVHIEARGTVQNWESPSKALEKEVAYTGPERRKDKRYKTPTVEMAFAKGSLGKIGGRRYPLHNLSQTGASFTSPVSLARSDSLRMKIFTEDQGGIEVTAKVIWTNPIAAQALFRVGVQFTSISEVTKIQIQNLIGKCHRPPAPKQPS